MFSNRGLKMRRYGSSKGWYGSVCFTLNLAGVLPCPLIYFIKQFPGILATQEVLRGVGVGDKDATPLAATITWVLKDGCGHIGRILFAFTHGSHLDAYSKKWRLYADILNNAAMCIEITLPMFKSYSLFALCTSTVMKAIVGVAGGATRIAMTQHHAIMGNIADVSAKDSAQETAVNLIASITALLILTTFGNSLTIFMFLMMLHVMSNYLAVRAVCLRTLNEPRFLLVIDRYLRHEIVATPCEINKCEPIVFYQLGPCILDMKLCGFKIKLGTSMARLSKKVVNPTFLNTLNDIYRERSYMLISCIEKRTLHILIREKATAADILCSYFHAVLLAIITCALNDEPLAVYKNQESRPFAQVCQTLQAVEWSREEARVPACQFTYNASEDLLRYLDKIVQKEWPRISNGLAQTGWDLSKHHLITDQWRVSSTVTAAKQVSIEKNINSQLIIDDMVEHHQEFPFDGVLDELRPRLSDNPSNPSLTIELTQTPRISEHLNVILPERKSAEGMEDAVQTNNKKRHNEAVQT